MVAPTVLNLLIDRLEAVEIENKDLKVRILKLEQSVTVKAKKWELDEDRYLIHLASNISLTKDMLRTRETIFLKLVQAHQQAHERTERAITMRLNLKYFK